jgi:hypothetical protein
MIREIKERTLPGVGDTKAAVRKNFLLHYVWELVDAVSYENPIILEFFDYENEDDLEHKADVLERVYLGEDVSEDELIGILDLYPVGKNGEEPDVKW